MPAVKCPLCEGTGTMGKDNKTCPRCDGEGYIEGAVKCPLCEGTGTMGEDDETCPRCDGKGYLGDEGDEVGFWDSVKFFLIAVPFAAAGLGWILYWLGAPIPLKWCVVPTIIAILIILPPIIEKARKWSERK